VQRFHVKELGLFSGPMSEKKMPTPNYLLKYKASNNFI
jgi:hypothetical protein